MSHYANKLISIAAKKQKLIDEEKKLIEKRKKEIALLAERFNLLATPDNILVGLFAEAEKALANKDGKVKEWESIGARFLKTTKPNTKAIAKNESHA